MQMARVPDLEGRFLKGFATNLRCGNGAFQDDNSGLGQSRFVLGQELRQDLPDGLWALIPPWKSPSKSLTTLDMAFASP
jgi:hypothetical protein